MGRDWAPFEVYLEEQRQIKMGYGDLFYHLENLKFKYGKKEICFSPEEMAIRRQFPQLGRLLMNNNFMVLYEKLSKIEGGLELLHKRDDELGTFLKAGKIDEPEPGHSVLNVPDIGIDTDSYLFKWFAGKLDENFHYAELNNQLFVEAMVKEAVLKGLENAVAIEYKGIVFDEWTADENGIWGEMCQCCAEKYKDVLSDELDDSAAMGACSVKGCDIVGADTDYEKHYYIDFEPEFIKPLSLEALLKKQFGEILEYEQDAQEKWGDLVDVMTPQECADLFGKPVRCGDEIFMPQENSKVALDEQINKAAGNVKRPKEAPRKEIEAER